MQHVGLGEIWGLRACTWVHEVQNRGPFARVRWNRVWEGWFLLQSKVVKLSGSEYPPGKPSFPNISYLWSRQASQAYHTHKSDLSPWSGRIKDSNSWVWRCPGMDCSRSRPWAKGSSERMFGRWYQEALSQGEGVEQGATGQPGNQALLLKAGSCCSLPKSQ